MFGSSSLLDFFSLISSLLENVLKHEMLSLLPCSKEIII